jgi:4-amino-4-deoxy-L-arabinose transferase-like glycosyltransferase
MRAHGDLNPRYFLHPSLLLYSTYFSNFVWQSFGLLSGAFESTLIFSGRIVSALAGSMSCVLLMLIGQRLFGLRVGFIAGLLLAVLPLHVTCSRYVKEDVLMTFWFLACVYAVVVAVTSRRGWLLLLAGVCAGFAFATKYTGLLSIVALATCPWIPTKKFFPDSYLFRWTVRGLFCAALAFLIASPYILLDLQTFLRDFGYEQRHMLRGHTTAVSAWSQLWVFHVGRSLIPGMSLPVFLLAVLGLGMLACRKDRLGFYVIGLALLYYLPAEWVKAKPEPQPERYVVPCLPFLALASAYGIASLKMPARILSLILLVLVLTPVTLRSLDLAKDLSPDTREQMSTWINRNIPAGSLIAYDWRPYNPMPSADRYQSYAIPRDNTIAELSFARLQEKGVDYLLLSSLFYGRYFKQPVEAPLREHFRKIFRSGRALHQAVSENGTYGFHNPAITIFAVSERAQQAFKGRMSSAPYVFEQGY